MFLSFLYQICYQPIAGINVLIDGLFSVFPGMNTFSVIPTIMYLSQVVHQRVNEDSFAFVGDKGAA